MKISLIGSGNVAYQLAKIFTEKGVNLLDVRSRNIDNGAAIAAEFKVVFSNLIYEANPKADIIILAVSDDAINEIASKISKTNTIVCHTSGTESTEVLKEISPNFGSFYPLQTFTKNRKVDFSTIPVLIDGSNENVKQTLFKLGEMISENVSFLSNEQRMLIHPAAVMVNNFSNHLFTLAEKYCEDKNLNFNILKPLIKETVEKISEVSPSQNQTGPAKRRDTKTIEKHLSLIEDEKLKELYLLFTESIQKTYE